MDYPPFIHKSEKPYFDVAVKCGIIYPEEFTIDRTREKCLCDIRYKDIIYRTGKDSVPLGKTWLPSIRDHLWPFVNVTVDFQTDTRGYVCTLCGRVVMKSRRLELRRRIRSRRKFDKSFATI